MSFTMNTKVIGTGAKVRDLVFNPVSGYTRAEYDILVRRIGFTDDGDYASQRTSWTLSGYTGANTDTTSDGQVLYVTVTGTTNAVVSVYDDSAKTSKVAEGTVVRADGGEVTLAAQGGSGLSGTVTLAAASTNDDFTVTIEDYHDRYDNDVDASSDNIIGIDNGLLRDFEDSTVRNIVGLVFETTGAKLDELGVDNVADHFERRVLIDNLLDKNITVI